MSNSIWKTPDVKPDRNKPIIIQCSNGAIMSSPGGLWGHNVRDGDRWAYLHEVVAQADKAERLEKENEAMREEFEVWHGNHKCVLEDLEIARKALKEISLHYQDELDKPNAPAKWFAVATKMCDYADEALEQTEHIADISKMI